MLSVPYCSVPYCRKKNIDCIVQKKNNNAIHKKITMILNILSEVLVLAVCQRVIAGGNHTSYLRQQRFDQTEVTVAAAKRSFVEHHHLKADIKLDIFDFSQGQDSFQVNGKTYSIADLQQKKIYAEDATFSLNGEEMLKLKNEDSGIFVGNQNGDHVMVAREGGVKGHIESIVIMPDNAPEIYMEAVAPNVLAVVNPFDYNPEYATLLNTLDFGGRRSSESFFKGKQRTFGSTGKIDRSMQLTNTCHKRYEMKLSIVFDTTFCDLSTSWGKAKSRIEAFLANASTRYEKQGICTTIVVGKMDGYCNKIYDPYADMVASSGNLGCTSGNGGLLTTFGDYYKANYKNVDRTAAHLFIGRKRTGNNIGWYVCYSFCEHPITHYT